jgi:hypothetical protein
MNGSRALRTSLALALVVAVAACSPADAPAASATASARPDRPPAATASASAAPSVAAPSDTPDELGEIAWEHATMPSLGQDSVVIDVEAAGPGCGALATSGPTGSAILTSPDGRSWTAVQQPRWTSVGLSGMVEAADGRLVAVGRDTTDVDTNVAMVWISEDGIEWRRAEGGPDLDGAQLIDVIETDTGFVAIGGYPTRDAAGAWTSPDGEIWTRAAETETFQHAFAWAVAEVGPNVVAVGWRRDEGPSGFAPATWFSADGVHWTLSATPDGPPGTQVRDLAASGGVVAAVGDLLVGGESFAWLSADGMWWEPVETSSTFEGAVVADVAAIGGGFVAVGGRNVDDGGVWISRDGRDWTLVEHAVFDDASLVETLQVGGDLIVVGNTQERIAGTESYAWQPMIWYGSPRP